MSDQHSNITQCKCEHRWRPMAWHTGGNVTCPQCGAWNQVGQVHPSWSNQDWDGGWREPSDWSGAEWAEIRGDTVKLIPVGR